MNTRQAVSGGKAVESKGINGKKENVMKKQGSLDGIVKKVAFNEEKEKEKEKGRISELENMVLEEIQKWKMEKFEMEKMMIHLNLKEVKMVEKLAKVEKEVEMLREDLRKEKERAGLLERRMLRAEKEEESEEGKEAASIISGESRGSRLSRKSRYSEAGSTCILEIEVKGMKKQFYELERRSRELNFIIREVNLKEIREAEEKSWVKAFIEEKLGLRVDIVSARVSGKVIVGTVSRMEEKKAIMRCKNKLKGSIFFIEYDLSFADRKRQEEISRWVKQLRERGLEVKTGNGRVLIDNQWVDWENKERREELVEEVERKRKVGGGESTQGKGRVKDNEEGLA